MTKNFAMEMGIPWYQVPRGIDFRMTGWEIPRNVSHGCHLGVVVSFGYKIPSSLIQNYPLGMINMHPSILPKYRGAAPIPRAIMNGDSEIGVSIIEIHPELMDGGEILLQEKHPIKEDDTFPVLAEALAEKGAENVIKVIRDLAEYRKNANPVTLEKFRSFPLAKKIKSEEGRIVWEEMTAAEIYCRYRGLKGLVSIFANLKGKRVNLTDIESESKIREIAIEPIKDLDQWSKTPSPGLCKAIFCKPDQTSGSTKPEILLVIQCKGGSIIGVRKLHIETKKEIKAREFVNGYLCQVKEIHFN